MYSPTDGNYTGALAMLQTSIPGTTPWNPRPGRGSLQFKELLGHFLFSIIQVSSSLFASTGNTGDRGRLESLMFRVSSSDL